MKSLTNSNFIKKILVIFIASIMLSNLSSSSIFAVDNMSSTSNSSSAEYVATDLSTDNINISSTSNMPTTYSPACILMNADSGKILYNKNANAKMYPASTTKIMTAILTLEKCNLTDTAIASHNAVFSVPTGYVTANIQEGEELSIEQLLNVLLIPSANDAAVVLAEHIAGSVEAFANMMNAKAEELGCLNTHFVNPNGIHNENHYTTAYDLAIMGKYAMKFDTFRNIVSKTRCSLPKNDKYGIDERLFNTTNELIKENYSSSPTNYYYKYATGAKTGYTDAAQNCIVATATKDDTSLIAVILHDENTDEGLSQRAIDCKSLFEYGFNNFSTKQIAAKGSVARQITVKGATQDTAKLDLVYSDDILALIPNDYDLSSSIEDIKLTEDISAPISEGTNLGTVTFNIDNIDYSCSLLASHNVYKSNFTKTLMELILLIVFLILLSKYLKFRNNRKKTRSRKKRKKGKKTYMNNFYPNYK